MIENTFIQTLVTHISKERSLNESIAEVLDISYDAAHRRASGKSKFSLEEGVQLARYFGISLDKIFNTSQKDFVAVEKTLLIASEKDLEAYYNRSYDEINSISKKEECEILYSAKDIPIFYTLSNKVLSRFKAFVWLKILDPKFKKLSFGDYWPPQSLLESAEKLGNLYLKFQRKEIWDITTINSLLKQVHFYFHIQQLTASEAFVVITELKTLIQQIEEELNFKKDSICLYHNELLLMNNSVLIKGQEMKYLYIPFSMLSYYRTNDATTCRQAEDFLDKQLYHSKLLNTSGEKEQRTFFNKIYTKIDALEQLIKATLTLDFQ